MCLHMLIWTFLPEASIRRYHEKKRHFLQRIADHCSFYLHAPESSTHFSPTRIMSTITKISVKYKRIY